MSDEESVEEGFSLERRKSGQESVIVDPFALAAKKKKVSYGTFGSMSTWRGEELSRRRKKGEG